MDPNLLLPVTFLAVLVLETFVGMFANIFIIFAICVHGTKRRNVNGSDMILVRLAIASVFHASMLTFNILTNYTWPEIYKEVSVSSAVFCLTLYSDTSCAWVAACLYFFYFSKITTFSCRPLRWVKLNIHTVVKWLILASEIASVCSSFPIYLLLNKPKSVISDDNLVITNSSLDAYNISLRNSSFLFTCVPIFIIIITTASSVVSLNLHAKKMKSKMTTNNGNIRTYQKIVHNMLCLLLFYVTFYVSLFLLIFGVFPMLSTPYWIILIIMFSFTPVHSLFLILVTPKLKEAWIHGFNVIKAKVSNVGL